MPEVATHQKTSNPILDPVLYFRVTAWALTVVTILGFVTWGLQQTPANQWSSFNGSFLQFTLGHNILHLVLAAACFLFGYASLQGNVVKTFAIVFGAVYLLLGVVGFFMWNQADDTIFALTPSLNIVHILLGGWALAAGLMARY